MLIKTMMSTYLQYIFLRKIYIRVRRRKNFIDTKNDGL